MKVLVCGSRGWTERKPIFDRIASLPHGTMLIHGGAPGADTIAAQAGWSLVWNVVAFPADWNRYGKRAGIVRNLAMLDESPDLVLAFWDGQSSGTAHTIGEARKRGIPVEVISP